MIFNFILKIIPSYYSFFMLTEQMIFNLILNFQYYSFYILTKQIIFIFILNIDLRKTIKILILCKPSEVLFFLKKDKYLQRKH